MSKKPEDKVEIAKAIANKSQAAKRRVESVFTRIVHFLSMLFDRIIFKASNALIVSLIIAIGLFSMVYFSEQSASSIRSSREIENIPVEKVVNDQLYEVTGIPSTVNAIVQGEYVDLISLQNQANYSVAIDLTGLSEGTHFVNLEPRDFSQRIRVVLSPSRAEVTIRRKITQPFIFGHDFINTNKLSAEYVLGEPTFSQSEVIVSASQETINQISHIKALIDVNNKTESFEVEAPLVAYNQNGQPMDINILPKSVTANVGLTSPNKQVSVKLKVEGTIPNNMAIASYELDHEQLVIYGPEDKLATVNSITIPINGSSLSNVESSLVHAITLPEGIRKASQDRVRVQLSLESKVEETVENINIFFENNTNNYLVDLIDNQQPVMDVILTGAPTMIESIDLSKIRVTADLSNLGVGNHEVSVKVSGPSDFVVYRPSQTKISIEIKENS